VFLFGLASAPQAFTRFADSILDTIIHNAPSASFRADMLLICKYVDDFSGFGTQSETNKQFGS
jgi:hypothetical protein